MAKRLSGKEVADELTVRSQARAEALRKRGVTPALAIVRMGERPGDLSYERGAVKRAEKTGIEVKKFVLDEDIPQEDLLEIIDRINEDESIDGVLMLRPFPPQIDEALACERLSPAKDMDGITSGSMAGVFMDTGRGYPPCTAEACMAILDHYGVDLKGKKVTVMGRSLVIGKPVAMMALKRNATVTMLHSKTDREDFARAGQRADVVIAAIGRAKMIGADKLGEEQIILDVGINVDQEGNLCGDVDYDEAEQRAAMITPVPGGVGSVTTAVLMKHVLDAAESRR
ncbi:MAG: bifunctional 5,10-methylene-tetrahydrofolate dehydrogenase/5,10-methylene-tetrahydrofolate cyclohydrolase [Firmicutes bacterium]|nr:bifunctional 5,10-methylene-tetrahydrofolate dehydrogenase/5,10-methylene-tetrahydrofolate cyclohydrolase [Bacillota bacterium]